MHRMFNESKKNVYFVSFGEGYVYKYFKIYENSLLVFLSLSSLDTTFGSNDNCYACLGPLVCYALHRLTNFLHYTIGCRS